MGLDGQTNRIAHYFTELAPSALSNDTKAIGLHLSKSQAFTAGLDARPQVHTIHGVGYADCINKAEAFIEANFPGCVL